MFVLLMEWATSNLLLVVLGGILSAFGITAGVRAVHKARKRRSAGYVKDIERSRAAKKDTVRARQKAKRKTQPLGVVVRKRASDDPRLVRKVVRKIKTARMNSKAQAPDRPSVLQLASTRITDAAGPVLSGKPRTGKTREQDQTFKHVCNAVNESDGLGCRNLQHPVGSGACWIPSHQMQVRDQ